MNGKFKQMTLTRATKKLFIQQLIQFPTLHKSLCKYFVQISWIYYVNSI